MCGQVCGGRALGGGVVGREVQRRAGWGRPEGQALPHCTLAASPPAPSLGSLLPPPPPLFPHLQEYFTKIEDRPSEAAGSGRPAACGGTGPLPLGEACLSCAAAQLRSRQGRARRSAQLPLLLRRPRTPAVVIERVERLLVRMEATLMG